MLWATAEVGLGLQNDSSLHMAVILESDIISDSEICVAVRVTACDAIWSDRNIHDLFWYFNCAVYLIIFCFQGSVWTLIREPCNQMCSTSQVVCQKPDSV